jgi:hypothetical protein
MSLQDLMRRMWQLPVREQVYNLNVVLRGHYAYLASPEISMRCTRCIGP